MNSRTAGRWIAAPLTFVGVRWATANIRTAPTWVRAAVVGAGTVALALLGVLILAAIFVRLFPRLAARLFPWLPAAQRREGRAP